MAASSTSTKTPCIACGNKSVGIFKCEGCLQTFCRKHANEHRDILSQQLDEVVLEYDTLQHTITEQSDSKKSQELLLKQVDEWEKKSIDKVQQVALEVRKQIETLNISQTGNISSQLHGLAERLQKARENDDFVETDLQNWTTTLETLQSEIKTIIFPFILHEDSAKFIGQLNIICTEKRVEEKETFGESSSQISIIYDGYFALHTDVEYGDAFVRGIGEYSSGRHRIQFVMKGNESGFVRFFGIISKSKSIPQNEDDLYEAIYGWYTDDDIASPDSELSNSEDICDLKNKTSLKIELILDCDNQVISYINQETKLTREIKIDTKICPFPWQILFYLYDVNDSVELIPFN